MESIPQDATPLLEGRHFASVSTLMPDGSPQVTTVWVDHDGDTILFNTAKGRQKHRNLERDPRIAVAVYNSENPYQQLHVRGRVTEMTTAGADEHIDALAKRYMDADSYPFRQEGEVRLVVKVEPEKVNFSG